ncbi:MAG: hypothetical protein NC930_09385 [Candidatus Omnitrophica bacterium]|nr:hypothetical protein [Candidatus Omnitrophota bacterium]
MRKVMEFFAKQKRRIFRWAVILLAAAVLFSIIRGRVRYEMPPPKDLIMPPAEIRAEKFVPRRSISLEEKQRNQQSGLHQPWGRDPFSAALIGGMPGIRADGTRTLDIESLDLTGILVSGKRKVAIINRIFVREGDSVEGMMIEKIEKDRVLLKNGNEEIILRIGAK